MTRCSGFVSGSAATHPVDEDVPRQRGGGLLQAAEAVHHAAVVEGQRDLRQTASCKTKGPVKPVTRTKPKTSPFSSPLAPFTSGPKQKTDSNEFTHAVP